jgi:ABC-2 type transport system ATP-binding protein
MNDDAIVVEGLQKSYGSVRALCGVDFSARTGSVLGLLGPNGAGKTTAVRILTTLLQPDGGTARVAGHDVVRDAAALRAKIGLAGQYAAVDENLTGFENLEMVGQLYHMPRKEARTRADELLERFDLTEAAKRPAKTYSGGMRRRLDLAAALVYRPPVLFLDEPTTGLDPQSRLFLWDTMSGLRDRGVTLLLTTHDMVEADRLCDRIAIVDHGRIIALDTPLGLRRLLPAESGLEVVLDDGEDPAGAFAGLQWVERATTARERERWHARLYGDAANGAVEAAVEAVRGAGRELIELRRIEGTLEDVFVHLTGRELR